MVGPDGGTMDTVPVGKDIKLREETQSVLSILLGGKNRLNDWTIDYQLGYAKAREEEPDRIDTEFVGEFDGLSYTRGREFSVAGPAGLYEAGNYLLDEVVVEDNNTEDEEWTLALNVKKDMEFGDKPGFVQFGGKARLREKFNDETVYAPVSATAQANSASTTMISCAGSSSTRMKRRCTPFSVPVPKPTFGSRPASLTRSMRSGANAPTPSATSRTASFDTMTSSVNGIISSMHVASDERLYYLFLNRSSGILDHVDVINHCKNLPLLLRKTYSVFIAPVLRDQLPFEILIEIEYADPAHRPGVEKTLLGDVETDELDVVVTQVPRDANKGLAHILGATL